MDQQTLDYLVQKLKIAPEYLVREYYEMVLLQILSETQLSKNLIFYGGTALRLVYNSPRFSEDLDFLMIRPISPTLLEKILIKLCKNYSALSLVEVKEKRNTLFSLLKFRHPALKHARHIKLEFCKKKNGITREHHLLHSDCSNFAPLISTATLPSLEKLKISAIRERREPRDWVDLWIIANLLKKPFHAPNPFPFEASEFKREMKRFLPQGPYLILDEILNSVHDA